MNTLEHRSTQASLGWMEPYEGLSRDRGQVLEGLNAELGCSDCLWTVGKAEEKGPPSARVSEQSLWLLYRLTGAGLEAGKLVGGCDWVDFFDSGWILMEP